jgi:hypothetical protein
MHFTHSCTPLGKLGIGRKFPTSIKNIFRKHASECHHDAEKLKAFLLKSGASKGCLLSPLIFSNILDVQLM